MPSKRAAMPALNAVAIIRLPGVEETFDGRQHDMDGGRFERLDEPLRQADGEAVA